MADIKGAVIVLILLAFVHGSSCCPCEDYSGYGHAVSGGHVYEPTYYYECTPLTIIEATYVPTCSCGYDPYGYNNDCSYLGDNSYYNHFHTDPYCWPSYGYNDYNGGGCYGGPSCGFQTASLAVVDTCGCNHYPFYSDPYYYPSYGYNDYLGDGCCRGLHCDCHSASFPVLETCGCRYDTYEHNCGSCYLGDNSYYDPLYTDPYCCHSYGCNDYNGGGCCGGQSCGCQTTLEVVETCGCNCNSHRHNYDFGYLGDKIYYDPFYTDPYCCHSNGYNDYNGNGCCGGQSCGCQSTLAVVETCGCNCNSHRHNYDFGYLGDNIYYDPFYTDPYCCHSNGYNDYNGNGCCGGQSCGCQSTLAVVETCGCNCNSHGHNYDFGYLGDNINYDPFYTDPYCCHSNGYNDYNGNGCCGGQSCGCQTTLEVVETCGCNCNSHGHNYDFGYLGDNINYDPFYTDPYCCHSNGYNDYNGNGCCGGQSCGCQSTLAVVETCGCNCNSHRHNYDFGYLGDNIYYDPFYTDPYCCHSNGYNDYNGNGCCGGQSCGCQSTLEVVETCGCNCNSHGHNYDFGYLGDNIYYDPFYTDPYCCHSNGYNDYNGNGCCGGQSCGCQSTLAVVETCGCNCDSYGHNYGSGYKGEEKNYNPYYSNNYDCPYNGYNDCFEIGLCWGCQASAVGRKL